MKLTRSTSGQDLIEYALLASLIALAVLVGIQQLGDAVSDRYINIQTTAFPSNGVFVKAPTK